MANHEAKLQIVVVGYLQTVLPRGAVFWSVPNGGKMSPKRRMFASLMGELPGASDLMVLHLGRLHCIELKVKADKLTGVKKTTGQTDAQKAFQIVIEAAGAPYAVCRSTADVRDALTLWGIPIRERTA